MPDFVKGVINFRGDIVPVVDARVIFKMRTTDLQNYVIIVLEIEDLEKNIRVCVIVDNVKDVFSVEDEEIKSIPDLGLKYNPEYLAGMVKTKDSFITILNVDKIFSVRQTEDLVRNN